jgi:hypothetical protein
MNSERHLRFLRGVLVTGVLLASSSFCAAQSGPGNAEEQAALRAGFEASQEGRWAGAATIFSGIVHAHRERDEMAFAVPPRALLGLAIAYERLGRDVAAAETYGALAQIAPEVASDPVVRRSQSESVSRVYTKADMLFSSAIDLAQALPEGRGKALQNALAYILGTGEVEWGRKFAVQHNLDLEVGLSEAGSYLGNRGLPHMGAALLRLAESEIQREADVDVARRRNYTNFRAVPAPPTNYRSCINAYGTIVQCANTAPSPAKSSYTPPPFPPDEAANLRLQDQGLRKLLLAGAWRNIDSHEASRLFQEGNQLVRDASVPLQFSLPAPWWDVILVKKPNFPVGGAPTSIEFWGPRGMLKFEPDDSHRLQGTGQLRADVDWLRAVAFDELVSPGEQGATCTASAHLENEENPYEWKFMNTAADNQDVMIEGLLQKGREYLLAAKGLAGMSSDSIGRFAYASCE